MMEHSAILRNLKASIRCGTTCCWSVISCWLKVWNRLFLEGLVEGFHQVRNRPLLECHILPS